MKDLKVYANWVITRLLMEFGYGIFCINYMKKASTDMRYLVVPAFVTLFYIAWNNSYVFWLNNHVNEKSIGYMVSKLILSLPFMGIFIVEIVTAAYYPVCNHTYNEIIIYMVAVNSIMAMFIGNYVDVYTRKERKNKKKYHIKKSINVF